MESVVIQFPVAAPIIPEVEPCPFEEATEEIHDSLRAIRNDIRAMDEEFASFALEMRTSQAECISMLQSLITIQPVDAATKDLALVAAKQAAVSKVPFFVRWFA